ncbi:NADPH-dependent FMN reductase [Sphingomonas alba]|uniref:NAD(P)H-dependent oxidoreductase n=1 Tax=Sphingomonas alba TaxID=2908208 RepID=A0ABT0RK70_9SPHN|nr:NAD(P)H-dependent oxidoreductase [Sphingomonas alba]
MATGSRQLHILGLCGSLRASSINRAILEAARLLAPTPIGRLSIVDGSVAPHFNPDLDEPGRMPRAAADWRDLVQSADGVVISMPEYAGGVPGAFKNSLDWLAGSTAIYQKPVAIFAASNRGAAAQKSLASILEMLGTDIVVASCVNLGINGAEATARGLTADQGISTTIRAALGTLVDHIQSQGEILVE